MVRRDKSPYRFRVLGFAALAILGLWFYLSGSGKKVSQEPMLLSKPNPGTKDWAKKEYDICCVGSGISGATLAERYANVLGKSVLVIERRDHIGGNVYDYIDEVTGMRVSKYGAHLFHTIHTRVWEYIHKFSKWSTWEHEVLAKVNGILVPVPVNIDTVNLLFDAGIKSEEEMKVWLENEKKAEKFEKITNSEEMAISRVGRRLFDLMFAPYTMKQWDKEAKQLGPEVLARIPVRTDHDPRYFSDPFQALPSDGYTPIFERMLSHNLITVVLESDYFDYPNLKCGRTYYSGPISQYFADKGLPQLEYRSLQFEVWRFMNTTYYQPNSVVNFPSATVPYTRAVEYKHFPSSDETLPHTIVVFETSTDVGDPYYPVPNPKNKAIYERYKVLADQEKDVAFVGRLANYKYFNMDQAFLNALELFDRDRSLYE
jgi:UDP-galactopyranose mutase